MLAKMPNDVKFFNEFVPNIIERSDLVEFCTGAPIPVQMIVEESGLAPIPDNGGI